MSSGRLLFKNDEYGLFKWFWRVGGGGGRNLLFSSGSLGVDVLWLLLDLNFLLTGYGLHLFSFSELLLFSFVFRSGLEFFICCCCCCFSFPLSKSVMLKELIFLLFWVEFSIGLVDGEEASEAFDEDKQDLGDSVSCSFLAGDSISDGEELEDMPDVFCWVGVLGELMLSFDEEDESELLLVNIASAIEIGEDVDIWFYLIFFFFSIKFQIFA